MAGPRLPFLGLKVSLYLFVEVDGGRRGLDWGHGDENGDECQDHGCFHQNHLLLKVRKLALQSLDTFDVRMEPLKEKYLAMQLIRSSTSCGANYEESRGAESRPDFIHKMHIVLKEARESLYWIKLLKELDMGDSKKISELHERADELVRIMTTSVITAKNNKNNRR